jgi:hypothetical protein
MSNCRSEGIVAFAMEKSKPNESGRNPEGLCDYAAEAKPQEPEWLTESPRLSAKKAAEPRCLVWSVLRDGSIIRVAF